MFTDINQLIDHDRGLKGPAELFRAAFDRYAVLFGHSAPASTEIPLGKRNGYGSNPGIFGIKGIILPGRERVCNRRASWPYANDSHFSPGLVNCGVIEGQPPAFPAHGLKL